MAMQQREGIIVLFAVLSLLSLPFVSAACPDPTGTWLINTSTTQSTDVSECTLINVTNGSTLTLGNNISVNTTYFVIENGTVTHASKGRINITATNLTITPNGMINASDMGYAGGAADTNGEGYGNGTFGTTSVGPDGGSHGGNGGVGKYRTIENVRVYGNVTHPTTWGSGGGGGASAAGGEGGGFVFLNVTGTLNLSGPILAKGESRPSVGNGAGGGAGGSIWIVVGTLIGDAAMNARGGAGAWDGGIDDNNGGAGGGGRIAIHYADITAFTGEINASGGYGPGDGGTSGGAGTIYLLDRSTGFETLRITNAGVDESRKTNMSYAVSGNAYRGLELSDATVTGDPLNISSNATILLGNAYLDVPLVGTSRLYIGDGATLTHTMYNDTYPTRLNVTVTNLTIASGGSINLTARGYQGIGSTNGQGVGNGTVRSNGLGPDGGSHGGNGGMGNGRTIENVRTYGNLTNPVTAGSSGGAWSSNEGGDGGGILILNVTDSLNITGRIEANGIGGTVGDGSAGGAGGSLWITATTITSGGPIEARGGWGTHDGTTNPDDGGGGGGGRIAIYYGDMGGFTGAVNASGGKLISGAGDPGGAGTIYLKDTATGIDTLIITNTGVNANAKTNLSSGTGAYDYTYANITDAYLTGETLRIPGTTLLSSQVTSAAALDLPGNLTIESGANVVVNSTANASTIMVRMGSRARFNSSVIVSADLNVTASNVTMQRSLIVTRYLNISQDSRFGIGDTATLANMSVIDSSITTNYSLSARDVAVWNSTWTVNGSVSATSIDLKNATIASLVLGVLNITAVDITISADSSVNVTAKGYPGGGVGAVGNGLGNSSGASSVGSGGASHGGLGGNGVNGGVNGADITYGNLTHPTSFGSGSGGSDNAGTAGGGAVVINVSGTLTCDGTIEANSINGTNSAGGDAPGGGSGGSVLIIANALAGGGSIQAIGGAGGITTDDGGGGGGGRIGIHYGSWSMTGTLAAAGGNSMGGSSYDGGAGTIYLHEIGTDIDQLIISNQGIGELGITNMTAETGPVVFRNLNLTNATLSGIQLAVNDTTTVNVGTVYLNNRIIGTSNITIVDGGVLGHTDNDAEGLWRLNISGNNMNVSGRIDVWSLGYPGSSAVGAVGNGPGNSSGASSVGSGGASHGGAGGNGVNGGSNGGTTIYGDLVQPTTLGSGSGGSDDTGADGGGAAFINLTGTLFVNGWIRADGENGTNSAGGDAPGGGSGGSVWIVANAISGTGNITADGGLGGFTTDDGGSGGGGRISVSYRTYSFAGLLRAKGGAASGGGGAGADGTIFQCQYAGGMSCPGSIGAISLSTLYLRNETVNITRNLTSDWNDTRMVWNETSTRPETIGEYVLSGLTYANYKVWHNATFNDSLFNNAGTLDAFQANITGRVQISVLAPNNTAPYNGNVTLNGSRHGPFIYPNEDLLCYANVSDADDFIVTATWTMYNGTAAYTNGEVNLTVDTGVTLLANISSTVTNPGETWTCGVVFSDSYVNLNEMNATRTLEYTQAPDLASLNITPQPAFTTDTLLGWCNGTDGDGDTLVYFYAWYRNNTLFTSSVANNGGANYTQGVLVNVANMSSANTVKGENWTFECMASQMIANSSRQNVSILINNTIPNAVSLSIASANGTNTTSQYLAASFAHDSDPDADTVDRIYDWRVNGTGLLLHQLTFDVNVSPGEQTRDYAYTPINGTLDGSIAWNNTGGWNGTGAYEFDGVNDRINITDGWSHVAYTLEAWVKPQDNTSVSIIVKTAGAPTTSWSHQLRITSTGFAEHYTYDGTVKSVNSTTPINKNQWYHLVGTAENNGVMRLYVNGVEEGGGARINTLDTTVTRWSIGSNSGHGMGYFNGTIDTVRIWNRSLSDEDVLALYRNRTDLIGPASTGVAENWSVCAWAADNGNVSGPLCSEGIAVVPGSAPTATLSVNTTYGLNTTGENLTAYPLVADPDGDGTSSAIDWRVNGVSIAYVDMSFNVNNSNGTDTVRDHSTFGHNGRLNGARWVERGGVNSTGAYFFSGRNVSIDLGNASTLKVGLNNLTITAWIRTPNTGADRTIIADRNTGTAGVVNGTFFGVCGAVAGLCDGAADDGAMRFWAETNGAYGYVDWTGADVDDDAWHFVAVVWTRGSEPTMYVDMASSQSVVNSFTDVTGSILPPTNLTIGTRPNGGTQNFTGFIDDLRVFNRSLTYDQLDALYRNGATVIVANETGAGENWSACVVPDDGWNQGNEVCTAGVVIGQDITTATPTITPAIAYANDTLLGWCNGTNPLASSINYHWQWYRNGTLNTSGYADNGGAGYTQGVLVNVANATGLTKADTWVFGCLASYAPLNGSWLNSSGRTVSSTPPTVTSIIVNSTSPYNATNGNVTAYPSFYDLDGDAPNRAIDWRRNGTSIAVLRMHFDVNNSNGTGSTRDYSMFGNNASVHVAVWNATGGWNGTAGYTFNGSANLNVSNATSLNLANTSNFSVTAWVKTGSLANVQQVIVAQGNDTVPRLPWLLLDTSAVSCSGDQVVSFIGGTATCGRISITTAWVHVAVTVQKQGVNDNITIYVDGVYGNSSLRNISSVTNPFLMIGGNGSRWFNGTMDELVIYNRTLSAQEVLALAQNRTDIVVSQELAAGDMWGACVTPNDGSGDGATSCSANITLISTSPFMNAANITPSPQVNQTDTNITGYCNATSPLGWTIAYNYTWYKTNSTDTGVVLGQGFSFAAGSVSGGGSHTCGIRANDSRVLCWGDNSNGQDGLGNATSPTRPALVNDTSAYTQVVAGSIHSCGVRANDSRVLCWGQNTNGQLGNGTQVGLGRSPQVIADTSGFANLSIGTNFACGIRANDSRVLCWGLNTGGQLGDGSVITRNTTNLTTDSNAYRQISSGGSTSCGIRASTGRVTCWGDGSFGQLGTGNTSNLNRPTLTVDTSAYVQVSAGGSHTCGIRANDSRVLCWGDNSFGMLGVGNTSALNRPTLITDTSAYLQVIATTYSTCGIRANDSRVLCWGSSQGIGLLGNGSANGFKTTSQLTNDTNETRFISRGESHLCVVRSQDGRVLCWGQNAAGQVGDGSVTTPVTYPKLTTDSASYAVGYTSGVKAYIGTLSATLRPGDNITLACTPYDFTTYGAELNSSVTTVMGVLNITNATIAPTAGYANQNLSGLCNATSSDIANITYLWRWYKNAALNLSGYATNGGSGYAPGVLANVSNITSGNLSANDIWIFSCQASDGLTNTSWRNSTGVTILNLPPSIGDVIVNSTFGTNLTTENLTAYATGLSDSEGDAVQLIYDWRVNGTSIMLLNMNFDVNNSAGTGKFRDHSSHGNNGTMSGNPWNATAGWNGTGAFHGRGAQALTLSSTGFDTLANFTMEAWVSKVNNGSVNVQPLLSKYIRYTDAICGSDEGWRWYLYQGKVCFDDFTGYSGLCSNSSLAYLPNMSAAHVVTMRNGSQLRHYINGVFAGNNTLSTAGPIASAQTLYLGFDDPQFYWDNGEFCEYSPGFATYFNGVIDNIRVYNRSLSPEQILNAHNNLSNVIASQELRASENWTACVTPNDGYSNGSTVCSAGLLVAGVTTDSCTPPGSGDWTVYAADYCAKTDENIVLSGGKLVLSGAQGPGNFTLTNTNVTASNVEVLAYGNLSRLVLQGGARLVRPTS